MRKPAQSRGWKGRGTQSGAVAKGRAKWRPKHQPSRPSYSTIEVCQLFDISKATLYRWEREGLISMPSRDWRNWRLYTQTNLAEVRSLIRRRSVQS